MRVLYMLLSISRRSFKPLCHRKESVSEPSNGFSHFEIAGDVLVYEVLVILSLSPLFNCCISSQLNPSGLITVYRRLSHHRKSVS